jgi:hypothetical protein
MLKNEVGRDSAAPALEHTTRNEGLLTEFNEAIADSTTLKVVGGTALLAGGIAATVAAVKFGKPLLGLGKAVAPEADETVLTAIREAAASGKVGERPFMMPATDALISAGRKIDVAGREALAMPKRDPLAALDPNGFRFALSKPGETGILGISQGGRIEPATDAMVSLRHRIPSGAALSARIDELVAFGDKTGSASLKPATETLSKQGKPVSFEEYASAATGQTRFSSRRIAFKEVDTNIPMFSTMDDIKALMPHPDSPGHRVVMKLDGVARDISVSDAISILSERAIKFTSANPSAAKALYERLPKPAVEKDIAAMAGRMAAIDVTKLPKI